MKCIAYLHFLKASILVGLISPSCVPTSFNILLIFASFQLKESICSSLLWLKLSNSCNISIRVSGFIPDIALNTWTKKRLVIITTKSLVFDFYRTKPSYNILYIGSQSLEAGFIFWKSGIFVIIYIGCQSLEAG